MRKKISRILGVALAVMLLTSLLVGFAAAPAGATAGRWAALSPPAAGGPGGFVHQATLGAVAGSLIEQGIDGTLWAYRDDGVATTPNLYRSTDGGYSWARVGGATLNNLALVDIVPDPTNASIVWVATNAVVYKSTNSGTGFTALVGNALMTVPGTTALITAFDVAYLGGSAYVFMATMGAAGAFGGIYVLGPAYGAAWADLMVDERISTSTAEETRLDCFEVKAFPDFATSQAIMAVVTDNANTWAATKYAGSNWNTQVNDGVDAAQLIATGGAVAATNAAVAIPANFDSVITNGLMEYFVAVDTGAIGDVFRIVLANAFDRNIAGAATDTRLTGLDGKGDVGTMHIIAGGAATARTYYSADNSATWLVSQNHPAGSGFMIEVALDNDFLSNTTAWVATRVNEGGIYKTTDGRNWRGVGLLRTAIATINDFAVGVGSETTFVSINDGADDMVWRNDGTHWELVLVDQVALFNPLRVAVTDTFGTDSTVFAGDTAARQLARSTDGGNRFVNQLTLVPVVWASWVIQSPNELLVGNGAGNGNVYQTINNGTTWNARACGIAGASIASIAKSPAYATDSTLVAGTTAGFVVRSVNTGTNWAQIPAGAGALAGVGNTFVTFNGANAEQIFAVTQGATSVYRYNFGDAAWSTTLVVGLAPAPGNTASTAITAASVGISSSPDGALYVADVGAGLGVSRCINPEAGLTPAATAPFFELVNFAGSGLPAAAITIVGPQVTPGSNKVWIGVNAPAVRLYWYDDVTVEGPTGLNAVNIGQTFASLTWGTIDPANRYIVHYNQTALGWAGATQIDSTTNGLAIAPATLITGTDYHFRVCVHEQSPALSRWSASFDFSTPMGAAQWSPFPVVGNFSPVPGAKGVDPVETLFQWNPSTSASGYEFQLSDNAAYAGADTKKVKSPTYGWPGDLEYGKTYYWRVRAYTADGKFSEWASGIFTTLEEPVPAAPPAAPAPPPAAPAPVIVPQAIPSFLLWTIVGIGVVLLIALIWLIMRTRAVR